MADKLLEEELKLTDIFHLELLQQLQDTFYDMTHLSMGISDSDGMPVTRHQACHEFCLKYTKGSELGAKRCLECDIKGAHLAQDKGEPVIYKCHTGLMDFAAPIIVDGKMLGSFLGGQVAEHPLDDEQTRRYAVELGIDPDEYVKASRRVPVMGRDHLIKLANFLSTLSNMMSRLAYRRYEIQNKSSEIEREANMKSDFLANMSHEIRTPMNAVIGMAEMALREDLPPAARNYINQIKTSGNSLLTIINDILDFSKIESGKMNINLMEYQPLSIINDVVNIIMTRIGEKNLELIVDFDPDIPLRLMGDSDRIKQIITNLANNAVKFTPQGRVLLKIACERTGEHEVLLKASVSDTGIGIKKEDLEKLFQSFSQLDSKRNRNIEGTGLGLAISKQLVTLMKGNIWVESEYGKGSTFSFEIPQLILHDEGPSIKIQEERTILAGVLAHEPYIQESLKKDITRFGCNCMTFSSSDELIQLEEQHAEFLFIDHAVFSSDVRSFVEHHPEITCVLMIAFRETVEYNISNLLIIKKPLYAANIGTILNREKLYRDLDTDPDAEFDFIAPEASALIVDDNEINLTVAEGLIEPLQMTVDTALSGKIAIDMISKKHYDLIFMDHMMPELDGVETTHIIRRFHEEYNDVPIIALTANAVEEMRSMFLTEGMNDFIAKPIEVSVMTAKIKQWLPEDKIVSCEPNNGSKTGQGALSSGKDDMSDRLKELSEVEGMDVKLAMEFLGNEKLLWQVIRDFYVVIDKKVNVIQQYYDDMDMHGYAIEVHALKSAAKQIGATELSEMAAELEKASKEENLELVQLHTDELLEKYLAYKDKLYPFVEEENAGGAVQAGKEASSEEIRAFFGQMREAIDDLDMDRMSDVVTGLSGYAFSQNQQELFEQLKEANEMMDVETCEALMEQWETMLE